MVWVHPSSFHYRENTVWLVFYSFNWYKHRKPQSCSCKQFQGELVSRGNKFPGGRLHRRSWTQHLKKTYLILAIKTIKDAWGQIQYLSKIAVFSIEVCSFAGRWRLLQQREFPGRRFEAGSGGRRPRCPTQAPSSQAHSLVFLQWVRRVIAEEEQSGWILFELKTKIKDGIKHASWSLRHWSLQPSPRQQPMHFYIPPIKSCFKCTTHLQSLCVCVCVCVCFHPVLNEIARPWGK